MRRPWSSDRRPTRRQFVLGVAALTSLKTPELPGINPNGGKKP